MRVHIQLEPDVAGELHQWLGSPSGGLEPPPRARALVHAMRDLGSQIQPMHPGQSHPLLVVHFMVDVLDRKTADALIKRLRRMKGVAGAQLAPDAQPP